MVVSGASSGNRTGTDRDERLIQRLIAGTYFDPLTGLFNRRTFAEAATVALARLPPGSRAAVVHLDVDGFARFNQILGTDVGDRVLIELANRLQRQMRAPDLVARSGDDEYLALVVETRETPSLEGRLDGLVASSSAPLAIDDKGLSLTVSAGAAIFPEDATDADALIARAGVALNACRSRGGQGLMRYDAGYAQRLEEALKLSQRLSRADVDRDLHLVFEPLVDCASLAVSGAETLLRWRPSGGAPVAPGTFIPLAEASGAIVPIGRWVLEQAFAALARWRALDAHDLDLAVNVSARQLQEPDFVQTVERAAARHGVPLGRVTIELTETAVVADVDLARRASTRLVTAGARLAIDDFGTGNATLATLQDLPASVLKIDRRFVADAPTNRRSRQLVAASVAIARSLEMQSVAEGVETEEQLALVRELGCTFAQGFFFTRSLSAQAFERRFLQPRPVAALSDE